MENTKSKLRRWTPKNGFIPREQYAKYPIHGVIKAISKQGTAIFVVKNGTGQGVWVDLSYFGEERVFQKDERFEFHVSFSTFLGRDGVYVLRTFLHSVREMEPSETFPEVLWFNMEARIESSIKTDKPNLFLLTITRQEDGDRREGYTIPYFSETGHHPEIGDCVIHFDLARFTWQIDPSGALFIEDDTTKPPMVSSTGKEIFNHKWYTFLIVEKISSNG